jgi:hypothetical protein
MEVQADHDQFLTAPVLAVINYLVLTRLVPEEARPGRGMRVLSVASIGSLGVFSGAYVVWLVGRWRKFPSPR